ncbi:MAG: hypothetical protein V3U53_03290, partial [bacterium]
MHGEKQENKKSSGYQKALHDSSLFSGAGSGFPAPDKTITMPELSQLSAGKSMTAASALMSGNGICYHERNTAKISPDPSCARF